MLTIRKASLQDIPLLLSFIKGIAAYEQLAHEVEATEELLERHLFGNKPVAESVIAFEKEVPVGFALYFFNFSTFRAMPGMYLEDLYVLPEYRGKGYGKLLFSHVLSQAKEHSCGRMEWNVLDWNNSAIAFYEHMGAKPLTGWTQYRINL